MKEMLTRKGAVGTLLVALALAAFATGYAGAAAAAPKKDKPLTTTAAINETTDTQAVETFNETRQDSTNLSVSGVVIRVSEASITLLGRANQDNDVALNSSDTNGDVNSSHWGFRHGRRNSLVLYTFAVDADTLVLRKKLGLGAMDEVNRGDQVQVWTESTNNNLATVIWDKSIWMTRINGTILSINDTDQTLVLQVRRGRTNYTTTVRITDETTFRDAASDCTDADADTDCDPEEDTGNLSFEDLQVGQRVIVQGVWGAKKMSIKAIDITVTDESTNTESVIAAITLPGTTDTFRSGTPVNLDGTCKNAAEQPVAGCTYSWEVKLVDNGSTDTVYGPTVASTTSTASFTPSLEPTVSSDAILRVSLTVAHGSATNTVTREIHRAPEKLVRVMYRTNPSGLKMMIDGVERTSPFKMTDAVGTSHTIQAISPQTRGANTYTFARWSQGGEATQTITTPNSRTTYVAKYTRSRTSNTEVVAAITQPATTDMFKSDVAVKLKGTCKNAANQAVAGCTYSWEVKLVDNGSTDTVYGPTVASTTSTASFIPSLDSTVSADALLRISLTVASGSLTNTVTREIHRAPPSPVSVTFRTSPKGLKMMIDGVERISPYKVTDAIGTSHTIEAISPQTKGIRTYVFANWSQGGDASQTITTPSENTAYIATFIRN